MAKQKPSQGEFEVRVKSDANLDEIQKQLAEEIGRIPDLRVDSVNRISPFGMSGGDIAISFVVSVLSSAAVHVFRNQIDDMAKKVSGSTRAALRVIFKKTPKGPTSE